MLDPDQRICGRGVLALRRAGIHVDLFPPEYMAQVEDQNREFSKDRVAAYEGASMKSVAAGAPPVIGLTLEKVELEPAPQWHWKFKCRMYWRNDGEQPLHLGMPRWIPAGIGLQGNAFAHRYQLWENNKWSTETLETVVAKDQQCRIWFGLDSDPKSIEIATTLFEKAGLGILAVPATETGKTMVDLRIRPRPVTFGSGT